MDENNEREIIMTDQIYITTQEGDTFRAYAIRATKKRVLLKFHDGLRIDKCWFHRVEFGMPVSVKLRDTFAHYETKAK